MIRIKLPSELTLKKPIAGETLTPEIETLREYINNMYVYGVKSITSGGITTVELINDAKRDFDMDHFNMLKDIPGATIEFYTPYIKVANVESEIPSYLPNSQYGLYDEEGNIIEDRLKTWREWVTKNYSIFEHEGFFYFRSIANTGKSLNYEVLKSLVADGIELVDKLPIIETVENV